MTEIETLEIAIQIGNFLIQLVGYIDQQEDTN